MFNPSTDTEWVRQNTSSSGIYPRVRKSSSNNTSKYIQAKGAFWGKLKGLSSTILNLAPPKIYIKSSINDLIHGKHGNCFLNCYCSNLHIYQLFILNKIGQICKSSVTIIIKFK